MYNIIFYMIIPLCLLTSDKQRGEIKHDGIMNMIKPNKLQGELLKAYLNEPVISVVAGWGSGKTTAMAMAIISHAMAHPNGASLYITDSNPRYRTVVHPSLTEWTVKLTDTEWLYSGLENKWTAPNGHVIWCRSYFRPNTKTADQNSLEGIDCGFACIDEAQVMSDEVMHKAMGRIRSAEALGPRLIICGLPTWGAWWVNSAQETGGKIIRATSFVNQDNLSKEWFEVAKKTLPSDEYEAMINNKPTPPSGLAVSTFDPIKHVLSEWKYEPSMSSYLAIDWGFRKPIVLVITHDDELDADILHLEFTPTEITISQLTRLILKKVWPRAHQHLAPHQDFIWIDGACGDKAGASRSDQTALSAFRTMGKAIPPNGIGMPIRYTTDPIRVDILNGLSRLRDIFERGQLYLTQDLWHKGLNSSSHSIARGITTYALDRHGKPQKNDLEHGIDALRYHVINWHWRDSPIQFKRAKVKEKRNRGFKKPFGGQF